MDRSQHLCLETLGSLRQCFTAHKQRGKLIVVEGTPGAGKSTLIAHLATAAKLTPVAQIDHHNAQNIRNHKHSRLDAWYVDQELARHTHILNCLKQGEYVIQDRSIISTFAYVFARASVDSDYQRIAQLRRHSCRVIKNRVFRPDVLLFLTCTISKSIARRAQWHNDRYSEWFDAGFLTHYWHFYENTMSSWWKPDLALDTTCLSVAESVSKGLSVLRAVLNA
jgi:thymidylate kinase